MRERSPTLRLGDLTDLIDLLHNQQECWPKGINKKVEFGEGNGEKRRKNEKTQFPLNISKRLVT